MFDVSAINKAMWEEDTEYLQENARCECCCADHTFGNCPARLWNGCRGQDTMTWVEIESWAKHYELFHGMTRDHFFIQGD